MTKRFAGFALAVALAVVLSATGTQTQAAEGDWGIGVYGGLYKPGPDLFDDSGIFGVRVGYMLTEHWALSGSVGFTSLEADEDELEDLGVSGDLEADLTLVDVNVFWLFRPENWFTFTAGGGIGGSFSSSDADLRLPGGRRVEFEDLEEDSFTANVGIGPIFRFGEGFTIRLMPRLRYFENREDDETDFESTLLFGWVIGG